MGLSKFMERVFLHSHRLIMRGLSKPRQPDGGSYLERRGFSPETGNYPGDWYQGNESSPSRMTLAALGIIGFGSFFALYNKKQNGFIVYCDPVDVFCQTHALTDEELANFRLRKVTEVDATHLLGERFGFANLPLKAPVFLMVCDPENLKTDIANVRLIPSQVFNRNQLWTGEEYQVVIFVYNKNARQHFVYCVRAHVLLQVSQHGIERDPLKIVGIGFEPGQAPKMTMKWITVIAEILSANPLPINMQSAGPSTAQPNPSI